jgi:hypothetical protein
MQIYIALDDNDGEASSFVIGAFSTEAIAEQAIRDHAGEPLKWKDAEAYSALGTKYAIVLVDLDEPV